MNRKELLEALSAVKPGLANKEIVEQSCSFVFLNGMAYTYNDEIAVGHPVPEGISGVVKAAELHSLLSKLPDEELEIEVTESELLVKGKKRSAGIALQSEILLPLDALTQKKKWKPLPTGFIEALKFCLISVGKDMTKPVLTCIHFKDDTVESCDNHRLGRWKLKDKISDVFLLPGSAAEKLPTYSPTEYAVSNEWIHFRNEKKAIFSARLIEGEYPDLSKFLAAKGTAIEFPKELGAILERAEVFMEEVDGMASLILENNYLHVQTKGPAGWFKEHIRLRYKGEKIEFQIRPEFLKDISAKLQVVEVCENILKFEGENFVHACSIIGIE